MLRGHLNKPVEARRLSEGGLGQMSSLGWFIRHDTTHYPGVHAGTGDPRHTACLGLAACMGAQAKVLIALPALLVTQWHFWGSGFLLGAQVKVLSARFLRSWWRSPVNLVVQAAQYLFFAFLIGALRCSLCAVYVHQTPACQLCLQSCGSTEDSLGSK